MSNEVAFGAVAPEVGQPLAECRHELLVGADDVDRFKLMGELSARTTPVGVFGPRGLRSLAGWVVVGGELGHGVDAGASVFLQRAQAGVAALGHQQRQADVGLGEVGERGVAQLVQRPAAGRLAEELLRAPVGQARTAGVRARVDRGGARPGDARRLVRNTGPVARPATSREIRCPVPVYQCR